MVNQISPQEFHLLVDNPTVRTKCPQDQITEAMIISRVRNGNLIAGDTIRVQCMNSDYTDLLAECEYRVISRKSDMVTHEVNDRDIRQIEEITYRVERWTEWRTVGGVEVTGPSLMPARNPTPGHYVSGEAQRVWNPIERIHEIRVGETVVATHSDKETANRIAAGELPLPEAV